MKSDLDRLMTENDIDGLLITGPGQHNPAMVYMTGGAHLTAADLVKPRDRDPVLFYSPMERDEAARSGLETRNIMEFPYKQFLEESGGDRVRATAMRYDRMLRDTGLGSGRIAVYGRTELNPFIALLKALEKLNPDLEFVGEPSGDSILLQAMATKDPIEIERIRRVGLITTEVVGMTAEFLGGHATSNGALVRSDGETLTVGDVKRRIDLWLAERGVEAPEGYIFAIGRDAGVPHSSGTDSDPIVLGKTIVFDIFPCEKGGGYHYDFTRTWSLGYATDAVEGLYDDVRSTFETVMASLKAGESTSRYQEQTCDLFEALGHATTRQDLKIQSGYVHSLGHGLGLHVHEAPWFRNKVYATPRDVLRPGSVVTVEPGLYYPEQEMGVRLEDTVAVHPDGRLEVLSSYPLDLVIPVKGS
ncbi:MAG TPA: Xaa-Pro peptidase family protein [Anaerolineales bacterium]|nr:Xaa-Pro peptidase family protein [Anaerolineales bacterium]